MVSEPTFLDVLEARKRIEPYLKPTALFRYAELDRSLGNETWVKHENHQPVGAFKVRGGINLLASLSAQERRRGVVTASTGNHGLSVAYAAHLFDVRAIVCVPVHANPVKVAGIRSLGAEVVESGADFDASRAYCEALAAKEGYRYIHSANEPLLIAGVGTMTLEVIEELPSVEVIIVPGGGGSGAAGACIVGQAVAPKVRIIGVQSRSAPAAHMSWAARELRAAPIATFAEGLATGVGFELTQTLLWRYLGEFLLVDDAEIRLGMRGFLQWAHTLVEGAGAATLAAALQLGDALRGNKVVLVASGGNVSLEQLTAMMTERRSR